MKALIIPGITAITYTIDFKEKVWVKNKIILDKQMIIGESALLYSPGLLRHFNEKLATPLTEEEMVAKLKIPYGGPESELYGNVLLYIKEQYSFYIIHPATLLYIDDPK